MELPVKKERNVGIEVFRCVTMIMIIMLHLTGQGGVLSGAAGSRGSYAAAYYLKTIGYCSVNCYAVISGFVNTERNFRFRKIFALWLEVVFWLLIPALICHLFIPSVTVTKEKWLEAFFPVSNRAYWYFNGYILLFALMPFLNRGMEQLDERQHRMILYFLFGTVCFLPFIGGADAFVTNSGYSGIWLIILYVFGAYFRLHGIPKFARWYVTIPTFFGCATASWMLDSLRLDLYKAGKIKSTDFIYKFLDRTLSYISPFMVVMAVCLLCFFAQIRVKPKPIRTVLTIMGRATFGVYLFHVGDMIWVHWLKNRYVDYGKMPPVKLLLAVIGISILLFLAWDALSIARIYLFRLVAMPFNRKKKNGPGSGSDTKSPAKT